MVVMIEKKYANVDLLMVSKMFGSEKKTLLRSLDIVILTRLLENMLMLRTNLKDPSKRRGLATVFFHK